MSIPAPMKFHPIFKDKIWGGDKIKTILNYNYDPLPNCGEAWMISGVPGFESVVSEGPLEGNTLTELVEIYMDELVGEQIFEKYNTDFPLLIKFIDARQWLSIQVHPDDELAQKRGLERGKTEMWYILDAEPGAELISGFRTKITKEKYVELLNNKKLQNVLNFEEVKKGDAFFMPAGRVHAIGPGILLAEIQQSSDTTYRIYDWDRTDAGGNSRELHLDQALDAIDFEVYSDYKIKYQPQTDKTVTLTDEKYFRTNLLHFHRAIGRDYSYADSFVIYIVTEGSADMKYEGGEMQLMKGDAVLVPASHKTVEIYPHHHINMLEVLAK